MTKKTARISIAKKPHTAATPDLFMKMRTREEKSGGLKLKRCHIYRKRQEAKKKEQSPLNLMTFQLIEL